MTDDEQRTPNVGHRSPDAPSPVATGEESDPPTAVDALLGTPPAGTQAGGTGQPLRSSPLLLVGAAAVHLFTASGVVFVFLAVAELCRPLPDARRVFLYLGIQVLIDAIDGPFARLLQVKRRLPTIDGRTIDDLVDYLSYTFVPLVLVWRMGWVPEPAAVWVIPAMVASLFGFANTGAKDEGGGFFLGFPSYWNLVAIYLGAFAVWLGPWPGGIAVLFLSLLTVLPVRFVYPNLAPRPWRLPTLAGAAVWTALLIAMMPAYPHVPGWLLVVSLVYPVYYVVLSVLLDARRRRLAALG